VTGIGFLGAGAIIREGMSIRGLTTAATLWVVAAIGMAIGAGYYVPGIVGTAIVLFSLWPLRLLAWRLTERMRPEERRLLLELRPGQSVTPLLRLLEEQGLRIESLELDEERDRRVVSLAVDKPSEPLLPLLSDLDYVLGVRWRR
jgi:putative Mg2+ transporter-C (MgtC) family protein